MRIFVNNFWKLYLLFIWHFLPFFELLIRFKQSIIIFLYALHRLSELSFPYIFYFFSTPPPPPPPTTTSFPLGGTKFSSSFFLQFNSLHMPLAPTPHFYGRTPWEEGKSKCLPLIFCFPSSEHWILVTVHSILFYLISITLQAKGDSINYTIFFSILVF